MVKTKIELPKERIEALCPHWKITEFGLRGSVLLEDFRPYNDIDIMVNWATDAHWTVLDCVCRQKDNLRLDYQFIFKYWSYFQ
ncbi:hypothetical protein NG799_24500 [Laspinema sp. D1]|uniref:Polymerase nucleotidyl transferase domain-containing protein n=1 Tax=Laspinema palackyanum D2a TaxID=2953684 RepID=A0ABT2MZQ5_9CYAN|nr:hypothetical protein [Laspinema sp. D2b]MCT7969480.1 hypothetical protein [Laspinema sp. D2a]